MMQNRYPLWKNIGLIFLVVLGFIYALPNIYPEYPVVQVSFGDQQNQSVLKQKVIHALEQEHIDYRQMTADEGSSQFAFPSTDVQLSARDIIQKVVGSEAMVALNLLPNTPKWLEKIGAFPMKQGLDLRGGIHFLLEVDVNRVIDRRLEGLLKSVGQSLREERIRYTGLKRTQGHSIQVVLKTPEIAAEALAFLTVQYVSEQVILNADRRSITLQLTDVERLEIERRTIDQTMTILRKRVNELGVGEAVVQQQGLNRVAVDLPGIQDAARAHQILGGTATLEFRLVDADHDPFEVKRTGITPIGTKLYTLNDYPLLLKDTVVLNGDSITSAMSNYDQDTAGAAVSIELGGGGESYFTHMTRENIGKRLAIVYVESKPIMDKEGNVLPQLLRSERVISAPVINSALGHRFQITGLSDSKEAANLALLLRTGALPTVIYPIEERTVGPSLGQENIHRGIVSLEVGMALIVMIMFFYYRLFGFFANIALCLNLMFLTALLSLLDATLTLPGIAGIVLTVGMAVDANVLINERIREELRAGVSVQAAIYAGYERAFSTILDANITTFIVALVLFSIGTGPIRGFAITLSLGLLTSMLTGVTYTRALVNAWYGSRRHVQALSIGI